MRQQHKGIALITALFVTAIATITVVSLTSRQFIDIRRTGNAINSEQAYVYALGAESVAKEALVQLANLAQTKADYAEMYGISIPVYSDEGIVVSVELEDMENRFNLNKLVKKNTDGKYEPDKTEQDRFQRIVSKVVSDLQLSGVSANDLVNAVTDWIDPDVDISFPGGAEDGEYMSMDPPYRAANRYMASISELKLVQGFNDPANEELKELLYGRKAEEEGEEDVQGLLRYVTALPDELTTVNINTIDEKVLLPFSSYWDANMISQALGDRANKPIEDPATFTGHAAFSEIGKNEPAQRDQFTKQIQGIFDSQSSHITLRSTVIVGDNQYGLRSLIWRDTATGKIEILARSMGTDEI